ncbi:hypothetical protein AAMO2058_001683600 [Amorphochlora amoebiformis]|mmetsp:Transcript_28262/g.45019  ORF Transcript_28262/g.45019 Transcript_28262/m.45019 type:complete len:268 (-) Transcript_28262:240-1043(-)
MRDRRRRRTNGIDPRMMFLLMQLARQISAMPYKPPATLVLMALNFAVHFYQHTLPLGIPQVCLHPAKILSGELKRLVFSAFYHGDDMHVYYNMSSLLWKGAQLEQAMGSEAFIGMSLVLLGLSHSIYVAVAWAMAEVGFYNSMNTCAIGYSAVLFAYKVVLNHASPRWTRIWGFSIPLKYACWAELVLISIMTPNASFIGHLCGILAGLIYVYGYNFVQPTLQSVPRSDGDGRRIRNGRLERNRRNQREREEWELQEALRRSREESG